MTWEEAIERIEFLKGVYSVDTETALNMAIEALSIEAMPIEEVWECVQPLKDKILDLEERLIDAEVVVRCKDCKHGERDAVYVYCTRYYRRIGTEDYCSSGERGDHD